MKKLLRIITDVKHLRRDYVNRFYRTDQGFILWWDWLRPRFLADVARVQAGRIVCRLKGHDIVDEGFGGPDSGCIDLVCRRCGWAAGRTWLY